MILFFTKDLFFVPVLQSAAKAHGADAVAVMSLDAPKLSEISPAELTTCVIDLTAAAPAELAELVNRLRSMFPTARVAAFGPHVQEGRLQAAREAGCHPVLTRGQFNSRLASLMEEWVSPAD